MLLNNSLQNSDIYQHNREVWQMGQGCVYILRPFKKPKTLGILDKTEKHVTWGQITDWNENQSSFCHMVGCRPNWAALWLNTLALKLNYNLSIRSPAIQWMQKKSWIDKQFMNGNQVLIHSWIMHTELQHFIQRFTHHINSLNFRKLDKFWL